MFACVCGFSTESEGELLSHFLERHRRSYGHDVDSSIEPKDADKKDRVSTELPSAA